MVSPVARGRDLSLAVQAMALRSLSADAEVRLSPTRLTWEGRVQPNPLSRSYRLQLDAKPRLTPSVRVLAPALEPDERGRLPHVYSDGSLCLSQPGDWTPRMLFASTFIPWACEWLVFYEIWRATDVWHGDGPEALNNVAQRSILHPYR